MGRRIRIVGAVSGPVGLAPHPMQSECVGLRLLIEGNSADGQSERVP